MNEQEPILDKRRVLKNSIKLYGRTLFTLVVGLYNSRVVLEVLGVDDFGVYSLIGSIVVMFSFFTSTMSSSMSRFFAFELAAGDKKRLRETFGTAMVVVAIVAVIILSITEGLCSFLIDRLNLPEASRGDAYVVYQFSIASVLLTIVQTCYLSVIIARERMGLFAYLDIVTSSLKLAAIMSLKFIDANKLILYSLLVFLVCLCMSSFTVIYCCRHFPECRTFPVFRKPLFKSLMSYSGWNLFKTSCDCFRPSAINVIVNIFFGVAVNAAVAIAMNVSSNIAKFTANVFVAFKPQIIKAYAIGEFSEMRSLFLNALRFSLLVLSVIAVPAVLEMPYILTLWLGSCPDYASLFCRLLCVSMYFEVMIAIIEFGINATARIRNFCLLNGLITISTAGFGAVAYYYGAPPQAIYIIQILTGMTCVLVDLTILHRLVPEIGLKEVYGLVCAIVSISAAAFALNYCIRMLISTSFLRLMIICVLNVVIIGSLSYRFLMNESMRHKILVRLHLTK